MPDKLTGEEREAMVAAEAAMEDGDNPLSPLPQFEAAWLAARGFYGRELDAAARIVRGLLYNDEERPQADIEAEATRFLSTGALRPGRGGSGEVEEFCEWARRFDWRQPQLAALADRPDAELQAAISGAKSWIAGRRWSWRFVAANYLLDGRFHG